jgi:hypothetical protein
VTVLLLPSGKVTFTDEPGSAEPPTVSVPFAFEVTEVPVGAVGAVLSVKLAAVAVDVLPAASLAVTDTEPEPCGVAEVAE